MMIRMHVARAFLPAHRPQAGSPLRGERRQECLRYMIILLLAGTAAFAQEPKGQGYVFAGPGVRKAPASSDGLVHVGGGGEGFVYKGLGLGAEIGYAFPSERVNAGIGIGSANVSYHFREATAGRKLVPFLTGGASVGFRRGTVGLANYGGGLTCWLKENLGLRFEVRDHAEVGPGSVHLVSFRVGISFR